MINISNKVNIKYNIICHLISGNGKTKTPKVVLLLHT